MSTDNTEKAQQLDNATSNAMLQDMVKLDDILEEEPLDFDNFDEWIMWMEGRLDDLDLWAAVTSEHRSYPDYTHGTRCAGKFADEWAAEYMLSHITKAVSDRYVLSRPLGGFEMLQVLRQPPKHFRLLDLPKELRIKIYKCAVIYRRPVYSLDTQDYFYQWEPIGWERFLLQIYPPEIPKPALLRVSRQVRHEASEIYYQFNHFEMAHKSAKSISPLSRVAKWATSLTIEDRKNLRELSIVESSWSSMRTDNLHLIHATSSPKQGLRAEIDEQLKVFLECDSAQQRKEREKVYKMYREKEAEYCAKVDQRRRYEGWTSSGIVEYFIDEPE